MDIINLETLWFILIGILWIGYFFLEGFDFGVGILLRLIGRDDADRRALVNSIGPFWDGNEVWLLVAGGATFAAFPEWYATLFSGFYLALFLILVALIIRGVAFEFRSKHDDPRWRDAWDWAIVVCSFVPALLWGVAFANMLHGVPIDSESEFTGGLVDLLSPYALMGGLTWLAIFVSGGALFLTLKTTSELRARARRASLVAAPTAAVLLTIFVAWTAVSSSDLEPWTAVIAVATVGAAVGAVVAGRRGFDGAAFIANGLATAGVVGTLLLDLYPRVLVSSTAEANSLTVFTAASTGYTLTVMTVVAAVMTPVVLLYQGWTYYVFRYRVGREDFAQMKNPIELVAGASRDASSNAP